MREWLTDRGTSTCPSHKSPPTVRTLSYPGLAWLGLAWLGLAWLGLAWLGLAWLSLAWFGLAWLGFSWLRLASLDKDGGCERALCCDGKWCAIRRTKQRLELEREG